MKIEHVTAREILDSRGNPTIEVDVVLKTVALGEQPYRPAHLQAAKKPWNCAMVIRKDITARVS